MSNNIFINARQTFRMAYSNKATFAFAVLLSFSLLLATFVGWKNYKVQNEQRLQYKKEVRKQWLANPDKHPHRMAHYGYLAFREKHELSFFDFGIESFAGVSIFLEAHKQNSVNFSEASFSNGMLRFGELSVAMVLQILFPLLIIFVGYNCISAERESGTLKILLCQNTTWKDLLWGKTFGLLALSLSIFIPLIILTIILWGILSNWQLSGDSVVRLLLLIGGYIIYFFVISVITALVSASSSGSRHALTTLLASWIFFIVMMPRVTQSIGNQIYPSPSKISFLAQIAEDVSKEGDSHNPDDPHYAKIKDSLMKKYNVDDVKKLPFNYGGFIMAEGEKITSSIYSQHQKDLNKTFENQNSITKLASFLNPYLALKEVSMILTASDYSTYTDFQNQAEQYRYGLAQKMNQLQIENISNEKPGEHEKPHMISRNNWASQKDFEYHFTTINEAVSKNSTAFLALLFWLTVSILGIQFSVKRIKTI
jgi:ABC-2 type transport system permease protein